MLVSGGGIVLRCPLHVGKLYWRHGVGGAARTCMEVRLCHWETEQDRRDGVPARGGDLVEESDGGAWRATGLARDRAVFVFAQPAVNEQSIRPVFPATGWPVRVAVRR